jgi:hypothetical protein
LSSSAPKSSAEAGVTEIPLARTLLALEFALAEEDTGDGDRFPEP